MATPYVECILYSDLYCIVILMLQPTGLFCVVNKNIREVLIKVKTIFLWLCMSVYNETVSLNFGLKLLGSLLRDRTG